MSKPTPETDAALLYSDCMWGCGHEFRLISDPEKFVVVGNEGIVVLAEFARQLESQRDEARAQLAAALEEIAHLQSLPKLSGA